MSKTSLISALLTAAFVQPIAAQDVPRLTANVGGGVTTPLNPTAQYTGLSGAFITGVGYNIDNNNAIIDEFMWAGLPPNRSAVHPIDAPFSSINLYSVTTNYRFQVESLNRSRFGVYTIAGGGWYYRHVRIDKNYVMPPFTTCLPDVCKSNSAAGVNVGLGFTTRISDSGWKIYVESRYHYTSHGNLRTSLLPVTFGIRF